MLKNMKKLFLQLALLIVMGTGMAQTQQHLTFKGVPMTGTLQEFTDAMVKTGLVFLGSEKGLSALAGDFAGFSGCIIGVETLPGFDVVNKITVLLPEKEEWSDLYKDYDKLKAMLTAKYGNPSYKAEKFDDLSDYDYQKMMLLSTGDCEWRTLFSPDLGDIELKIMGGSRSSTGQVCLTYHDRASTKKVLNSAMEDL